MSSHRLLSLAAAFVLVAASGPALAQEVCDDLIDNDGDGYIDEYDSQCQAGAVTCTVPVTPAAFTIAESRSTSATYNDLFWPVSGDVDGDGQTEIVAHSGIPGEIHVLDGRTLAVESTIPVDGDRGDNVAIANLDGDPELEVITLVHHVQRVIVADYVNGSWVLNISATTETSFDCNGNVGAGMGLGVADFDGDGIPEIYNGNEIWTTPADLSTGCTGCITKLIDTDRDAAGQYKGCRLGSSSGPEGKISQVADVLSAADCGGDPECDGPELIVAGEVWSVDVTTPSLTLRRDVNTFGAGTGYADGFAAVADLDGDGDLDVAVHGFAPGGNLYVYDPLESTVLRVYNLSGAGNHGFSPIAIADVWDEDLADDGDTTNDSVANVPELIVSRVNLLHTVNVLSATPVWTLAANDSSGSTAVTVFDFNGDGVSELAYRDTINMRVMYGGPIAYAPAGVNTSNRNYASFGCTSPTMNEGPAVADVDDDGAAELLVLCGSSTTATLKVFESSGASWRQSRAVWNQPIFSPGSINKSGEVFPVAQPKTTIIPPGSGETPLNGANIQISPLDLRPQSANQIPALDAVVSGVAAASTGVCGQASNEQDVVFTITNQGDAVLTGALSIAVYTAEPTTSGATPFVFTLGSSDAVLSGALPLAKGQSATFRNRVATGAATQLWVVANDDGGGGAGVPSADTDECDTTDNQGGPAACVDCDGGACTRLFGVVDLPGGGLGSFQCLVPEAGGSGEILCLVESGGTTEFGTTGTLVIGAPECQ